MRNEYTDYIAHGHKYFAVVDLGKKNSKGTKLRRYFYSANEYKNYLAGKKTLDDKLLGGVSKVANKLSGVKAIGKGLASTAKAIKNTNKEVKALKKSGLDDESARTEIRRRSAYQHMKRAGLEVTNDDGEQLEGKDKKGNKYRMDVDNRMIRKAVHQTDPDHWKDQSKELIKKENQAKKERNKPSDIFRRTVKVPNQGPAITKLPNKVGEAIDKTVGAKVRENFVERMVEKGINKANAEAMRKKLEETYQRATKISTSANNLKNRLDNLQEAFTSGDGDKALDAIDETLKDQEAIQKDIFTIVDEMMPEAKKVADTFLDMGKKTLDTATAGPKAVAGDAVDEYLKEHGMNKDEVSKEFLDELRENLKRNRK